MSGQREDWMLQVSHKVQVLGGSIPASDASANTEKWKTTEFRKKLLGGGDFSFKDHRSTICDIRTLVLEAIGDTIFLQAELVAEGREHSDWCCTSLQAGDPGRRLGIRVRYGTERGMVERWIRLGGAKNAMKIKSLVDMLDGRERDWIAEQPRRFLKEYRGKRS